MTGESIKRQEARKRRASGAAVDFDGKRLALARRMRRLQRTSLATKAGVSAAAITQFEKGTSRPTRSIVAELSLALGVPEEFFQQGRPIEQVSASAAHFRSLRSTPAIARDQARAFAEIGLAVVDILEQWVDLPRVNLSITPIRNEPSQSEITAMAEGVRRSFGLKEGPIAHVVRTLETNGVVVLRLPYFIDPYVDAFSTNAGHRPLVLLSPLKDDRARSRFDAAHELGHLIMHPDVEPGSKLIENQAHIFAAEFLAPSDQIEQDLPRKVDWDRLLHAKTKWGLSLRALAHRAHDLGLWSDFAYRRASQHLAIQGYPEQGPLGPPESPFLLGAAAALLEENGTSIEEIATVGRLPLDVVKTVIEMGSETKPRLSLSLSDLQS